MKRNPWLPLLSTPLSLVPLSERQHPGLWTVGCILDSPFSFHFIRSCIGATSAWFSPSQASGFILSISPHTREAPTNLSDSFGNLLHCLMLSDPHTLLYCTEHYQHWSFIFMSIYISFSVDSHLCVFLGIDPSHPHWYMCNANFVIDQVFIHTWVFVGGDFYHVELIYLITSVPIPVSSLLCLYNKPSYDVGQVPSYPIHLQPSRILNGIALNL